MNSLATVSDSPASPQAVSLVVNDSGDAADNNLFNGICDTSAAPGDQCTLRAAISEANFSSGNDTIAFSLPPGSTITLNTVLPDISGNLTITGPGSSLLTITRSTAAGTPDFRILTTVNGTTTNISGLTVTNGKTGVSSGGDGLPGGGIFNSNGSMALTDVVITGNSTGNGLERTVAGDFRGGFGGNGGGINSSGTLTMTDCVVSNNSTGNGGANTTSSSAQGGWGGFGGGIFASFTVTMTDCLVSNNRTGNGATGAGSGGSGGRGAGIYIAPGTLTLQDVTITGNRTGDSGGPTGGNSGYGGGIFSDGLNTTMSMTKVTISNNTTGNTNSRGDVGGGAGIYILEGSASLISSTVSNNHNGNADISSGAFGGGGFGGGIFNNGTLTVTNSLISGNSTGDGNLGSSNAGGGIANNFILTLINSTVSGNSAGAGANRGGGIYNGGTMRLTNCTVTSNMANNFNIGNGIVAAGGSNNLRNTIVAGNGPGGNGPDLDPGFSNTPFNSQGHNLIGNADGSTGFTTPGDQVGTGAAPLNPLLGPLANNGGPTLTHALLAGSPASDAGDNCVTDPTHCGDSNIPQLTTDQRGPGFNRIVDGPDANTTATVDIGAYETQAVFPNLADSNTNEDTTFTLGFEVTDSASITSIAATSSNTTLVPNNPANINVTGMGSSRTLTVIPVANLFGTSDITVTVNRTGGPESVTFTLTVNSVNDAPSFTKGPDQLLSENSPAQTIVNWATSISAGPANESGQTLAFQVSNNNPALFAVAPAITPSGTLTYTPTAGVGGSATITVALMDNGGTANGGNDTSATQTFTINVLEGGELRFQSGSLALTESGATLLITVSRIGGSAGEARVDFASSNGTATAGQDYTATSGTLTFADGVTTGTFSLVISDDTLDEPTETINLTLSNPGGSGAIGTQSTAQVSIFDNDPTPTLSINDVSVTEGSSGTIDAVFTVTLSTASGFTVTTNFATAANSATAPSDYLSTSGVLTFNPGDLTKTVSVTVNGDTTPEVHESFFVNLSNTTNAILSDSQGTGTILSDDAPGGRLAFNMVQNSVDESAGFATIVVNRTGDTSAPVTVDYATSTHSLTVVPCPTPSGIASERCDYTTAVGTLRFAAGDASKSFVVLINQDNFVEGPETLTLGLFNPTGGAVLTGSSIDLAILTILDDVTEPTQNPIDDAESFVRQHYHDFLNREADPGGLAFWTDQIVSCGTDAQCIEIKRINVSAAFYLSIEFQETGYLVERMYKVAYGTGLGTSSLGGGFHQLPVPIVRHNEFLPDTQEIGRDIIVGQPGWELALENNKQAFAARFAQRARFITAFPTSLTESQFVDRLNTNAGGVLLPAERIQLINDLATGAKTRAQVVRIIAEDSDLVISEKNRAFVLMEYFGYMRRNPNESPDADYTGFEFWLNKLNQFGGNFVNAEMVKAFIISGEYRQRFGQ